jgi:peptide deformylase
VIVIDASETRDQLLVLINPELWSTTGRQQVCEEGLPLGAGHLRQGRARRTCRRALPRPRRQGADNRGDGLLAVCLQHEMDHLEGKVFVEHLSQLKQIRIKAKLAKQARITA